MKKYVFASVLLAMAPLSFAAPPTSQELVATYQAQLKAVTLNDRAGLAATLDEGTCRDVREVFSIYRAKPAEAGILQAITRMDPASLGQLTPCEQTAQLTLGLTQLGKLTGVDGIPSQAALLGVVTDGPTRVYGVFRTSTSVNRVEVTTEELVSFAKNGQKWKIAGNSSLKSVLASIKSMNN